MVMTSTENLAPPRHQPDTPRPQEAGLREGLLSSMRAPLGRFSLEARDSLTSHPAVRSALSYALRLRAGRPDGDDPQGIARSIGRLCAAARCAPTTAMMRRVEDRILRLIQELDVTRLDWKQLQPD